MHHPRRSSVTSQASILGLLTLVAGVLWLAMPGRARAEETAPTVSSLEPQQGSTAGGTEVTITGTGFGSTTTTNTVTIGGAKATVTAASATSLTVTTPAGSAGPASVEVTNTSDLLSVTDSGAYTYIAPPIVETEPAFPISETSATLNASVNPNGGEVSKCEFEYGTTKGSLTSKVSCASLPGSGTGAISVSASLTGLTANTTYYFRISATNGSGTSKGSTEGSFTTLAPSTTAVELGTGSGTNPVQTPVTGTKLPRPVLGRTANMALVVGRVLMRLPGAKGFVTLTDAQQVPYGTVVEASRGEVSVTAATPGGGRWMGRFFDGRFVLTQASDG
ncbi:MAG: IPT/TIG domain-containing protein, partial [Solirubrobacteraceae bacterium]